MAYCYKHIRLDTNEPFYIGIGTDSEGKHTRANQKTKSLRSNWWNKIVNKTDYIVEIIIDNISKELALNYEIYYIYYYGRRDLEKGPLVNMTDGGEGGNGSERGLPWHNPEYSKKISDMQKGNKHWLGKNHTEETKQKMSRPNPLKGKPLTQEQKDHLSKVNKGKIVSEETRMRMSISGKGKNKGKVASKETREKISKSSLGRKMSEDHKEKMKILNKGKIISDETKKKISESNKGKIISDETREKLSKAGLGRKMSAESIEKRSKTRLGFKHTEESKNKMRLKRIEYNKLNYEITGITNYTP